MATLKVTNIRNESFAGDQLYLKTDGKIGIGTTAPDQMLHIKGDTPYIKFEDDNDNQDWQIEARAFFSIYDVNDSVHRLVVDGEGKVGIGTTSPSGFLTVTGSEGSQYSGSFTNASTQGWGLFVKGGADADDYSLRVQNKDATELLSVKSNGNVGIGTTSPTGGKLHIAHANEFGLYTSGGYNYQAKFESTDAEAAIVIEDSNSGTDYNRIGVITNDMAFTTNNSERLRITSTGKLGIGTTSPASTLHVDGAHSGGPIVTIHQTAGSSSADAGLEVETSSTGTYIQRWVNAGTEAARVTGAGFLGIGQANPDSPLEVAGTGPSLATIHKSNGATNDEARLILGALSGQQPDNRGAGIAAVNNGAGHDLIVKCSASHGLGPTEALRVHSNGDITVPSGSIKLSEAGQGINFHAHGTGTGVTSNILDDYEEGTWSPVLTGTSGSASWQYGATGKYTKIGREVTAHFSMQDYNGNLGGVNTITGWPFANGYRQYGGDFGLYNLNPPANSLGKFMYFAASGTTVYIYFEIDNAQGLSLDSGYLKSGTYIEGNFHYIV